MSALALALLLAAAPIAHSTAPAPGLSVLGVTLNHTTVKEIQRRLGKVAELPNGLTGALAASFICYQGKDGTRLLFISSDETGGLVSSLQLLAPGEPPLWDAEDRARGAVLDDCLVLKKLSLKTPITGGLRLGATSAELRARLGEPASAPAGGTDSAAARPTLRPSLAKPASLILHWFWSRESRRGLEDYRRESYVAADLREDRAVALRTGESLSN